MMIAIINRVMDIIRGTTNLEKAKKKGLNVGSNFFLGAGSFLDPSHCFLITIGDNVTLSSNVHVLCHDASTKKHLGYTKIGKVCIGNNVFIGANAIILPGVTIGNNVIVGAGSVVTHDIPEGQVWGGNPARFIISIDEYPSKCKKLKRFDSSYRINRINEDQKEEIKEAITDDRFGLIE